MSPEQVRNYVVNLNPGFWGKFWYYVFPFRKKVVLSNMRQVFSNVLSEDEIKKLAQSFYIHFFLTIAENVVMRFMSEEQLRDQVEVIGSEILINLSKQKKGIALLAGHLGNWEFAPIGGILRFKQFQGRFHFVRKKQVEFIEKILFHRYYQAGLKVIPQKNSLNLACDAIANNDIVVFVLDQHASVNVTHGIPVDFFGKKAGTYKSLAMIAQYMDVPVVPVVCYRRPDGKHVMEYFEPIPKISCENINEELYLNTRSYNETLEKMILKHPDQWFWAYRRWKLKD